MTNVQNTKRIMISLPDYLLQEVDGVAEKENSNRSELIRQAMRLYLLERKKRVLRENMQRGYMEMAKLNLHIASEAFHAEEDADLILDRCLSMVRICSSRITEFRSNPCTSASISTCVGSFAF